MSWHLSTSMIHAFGSSPSSRAPAEESSARSFLNTESCARLRSTRIAERSCFDAKKKATYRRSLSGMTYEHSTAVRGVARWISSLRDSPVSHFPSRASDSAPTTSETCGPRPTESFAKFDPGSRSWRTCRDFFQGVMATSERYSETWPRAGSMSDGIAYLRPRSGRRTSATGSGFWPTPSVRGDHNKKGLSEKSGDGLSTAVKAWPTPHGFSKDGRSNGPSGNELGRAVNRWPTPATSDWKSRSASERTLERNSRPLREVAWATASSHPRTHTPREVDHGVQLANQVGGSLNPDWVEWLMGWPLGWTSLEPLERPEPWIDWTSDPADEGTTPRIAAGVPLRVDRLKAIGNGQVPQCVAAAWRLLEQS